MRFTEEEQEGLDLDWFALDAQGHVGHFTTGALRPLPESVAVSREDLQRAKAYFRRELPAEPDAGRMSPQLPGLVTWRDDDAKARFLQDYMSMAERGLYSYDAFDPDSGPGRSGYYRIAIPTNPLTAAALPADVRAIVERTRFEGLRFSDAPELPDSAAQEG